MLFIAHLIACWYSIEVVFDFFAFLKTWSWKWRRKQKFTATIVYWCCWCRGLVLEFMQWVKCSSGFSVNSFANSNLRLNDGSGCAPCYAYYVCEEVGLLHLHYRNSLSSHTNGASTIMFWWERDLEQPRYSCFQRVWCEENGQFPWLLQPKKKTLVFCHNF